MVFQNYALYPHMNVRKNLGYGLKVRRTPKARSAAPRRGSRGDARARGAARPPPAQLSGGQRQRVAMGRAIVREPQAFLMDEPLSNLDAKLRVGMRASLAELHARLGVDDRLRHARPGRGDDARPACRGDARRADPPDRQAAEALRGAAGPLRRRVHRLAGDEPRRGARSTATSSSFGQYRVPLDAGAAAGRVRTATSSSASGPRASKTPRSRLGSCRRSTSRSPCSRSSAPTRTCSSASTRPR